MNSVLSEIPLAFENKISELILKDNSSCISGNGKLSFIRDNTSIIDTYFGSFSIGKWNTYCELETLFLSVRSIGHFRINIRNIEPGFGVEDFQSYEIHSNEETQHILEVENFNHLKGLFTLEIFCLGDDGEVTAIEWGTHDQPKNPVNLALVITTFNRQENVRQAVARITSDLMHKINLKIFVIDNGSNLELDREYENVELIPNKNYGGAGGFSRGLLEAMDDGSFTHCLFMDDDASCLSESMARTFRLLEHTKFDNLAIAGSMIFEEEPYIQHESGALFHGICQPLKHRLDLRDLGALVENEREEHIDYGGWWFFAFPISKVKELAFPFFVRGDDSNFSMQHDFYIVTLNGISSWQENFSYKSNPLTEYLDLRYHLIHRFHLDSLSDSRMDIIKTFWWFIKKDNYRYFYASAAAECESFNDFMKGPDFFENNLDAAAIRKKIGVLSQQEKLEPIEDVDSLGAAKELPSLNTPLARKFRKWSLNGHLVPKIFMSQKMRRVQKEHPPEHGVYMAKSVLYYHEYTQKGMVIKHSKTKFFSNYLRALLLSIKFIFKYSFIKKSYKDQYIKMTSIQTWSERYK